MLIESVPSRSDTALSSGARDLFRAYAGFLRSISACHGFDFDRFDQEILALPHPYTDANGELFLALADNIPVGCIAFRAFAAAVDSTTCEIKRLFVLPPHRGQGIAHSLIRTALDHARDRGFRTAILDTEPSSMQAANLLYRRLGFTEIDLQTANAYEGIVYLRKDLV